MAHQARDDKAIPQERSSKQRKVELIVKESTQKIMDIFALQEQMTVQETPADEVVDRIYEHAAPSLVGEYKAPAPAVLHHPPASVIEHAAPAQVIEDMSPAPAVTHAAFAPAIESVAPALVIEYTAPVSAVTHAACSSDRVCGALSLVEAHCTNNSSVPRCRSTRTWSSCTAWR